MNHGRFTDCSFLRAIGRNLLQEFFEKFNGDLASKKLVLPSIVATDDEFFTALSGMLMSPEGLPDRVNDVLHEVQELSTEDGHDRLMKGLFQAGLQLGLGDRPTPEEVALRVWLTSPELLATKYNEYRFSRLKLFVYYAKADDCLELGTASLKQADLSALVADLDRWFVRNGRGDETVVVQKFQIKGEDYYLVRHGGTYLRSSKVEKRKMEVLHYRPAKDDLIVYSPETDELRINAKTNGERELYRKAFGCFLHGFADYFQRNEMYTLHPIREFGAEALECHDIPGISKVVLTQLELEFDDQQKLSTTWKAVDLFKCPALPMANGLLPKGATLKEASFLIHLGKSMVPLEVKIIPPNTIRLAKQSALPCVQDWMSARGFKRPNRSSTLKV